MTPSLDEATTALRQRRVRRTAGLLVGGAVVATTVLAIPAVALVTSDDGEVPAAADTAVLSAVETTPVALAQPTTTTTTAPAPTPEEQFAADWASWTPEQQFQFRLWVSSDEERQQILRYLFPAPPPAPKRAPTPAPAPRPQSAPSQAGHSGPGGYLACVRQKESGGRYNINTGNGYYGAYQFLPSTWNATAQRAGRPDLVGVLPSNASPADQDAMAQALYATNGRQPWAGDGC